MAQQARRRYTAGEYLELERGSEERHEYLDGEVFGMGGASRRHNLIVGNVLAALHPRLRQRGCEIYASDMRVRVPATDLYTYPDLAIACGEPRFEDGELDTLLDPVLLVEVLSPTTQDYDRGTKFAHYRTLPSLREYLLLAQDRVHAEHFLRHDGGTWLLTETQDPTATLHLPALDCHLELARVYEGIIGEET